MIHTHYDKVGNPIINERTNYGKKLKRAAEEWRTTFDSMPYGVMLLDREFNIIKTNDYISELTGIPIKELIGKKCYKVIHGTNKPIEVCPLLKTKKVSGTESCEYYDARFNKHFKGYVTSVLDKEGLFQRYIISHIDITESKESEKKLIDSRDAFLNMLKDRDL
ncbi:MAG: PAS domain-containing protein [Nitrospirota bacterium]